MCTVLMLRRPGHEWPLIVGETRDENPIRQSEKPGRHWPENHSAVAGLDLGNPARGSWLGVNDEGVFATLVNLSGTVGAQGAQSRGKLVTDALKFKTAAEAREHFRAMDPQQFPPFFLTIADKKDAYTIQSNGHAVAVVDIPEGYSMVTPRGLNQITDPRHDRHIGTLKNTATPDPVRGDWQSWIDILSARSDKHPSDGVTIINKEKGVETVSSSLVAIPADSAKDNVFLYAAGKPGEVPYEVVDTTKKGAPQGFEANVKPATGRKLS